jgi:LmbE family N-acetylglucosaminyl deacetylase
MIVAHPDDESLFGGETLTLGGKWTVVSVTCAQNERRRDEFIAAMTSIGANYTMLNHFDHLGSGNFDARLDEQLAALLAEHPYEMVVTHNERGEYGHRQHIAVHRAVRRLIGATPLYVFDFSWALRGRICAAKRALLDHYESQRGIVGRASPLAGRERLRRVV